MKNLKFGMKGEAVAEMQRALVAQGYEIEETAEFDEATETALTQFQAAKNLLADGIFGKDTRAVLFEQQNDDVPVSKYLKESDIIQAAELLEVEPAAIKAVVRVESAGRGYLKDGRVLILFERHKFHDFLEKQNPALARETFAKYPNICNPKSGGYYGGVGEYPRFSLAFGIDKEIAMKSASWGLFQIMGFNHKSAGYDSIHDFVDAMKEGEGKQLLAFCNFVKSNKAMHAALKKQDWETFAKLYNGIAYKKNNYDSKLANAYARYKTSGNTAVA